MVHNRDIKQTTTQEVKMHITSEEAAKVIAEAVKQTTGTDCEAHTDDINTVITYNHTKTIAQVTTLFGVVAVTPSRGLFVGEVTTIPMEARTIDDIREIARALDTATSHVLNAALNH